MANQIQLSVYAIGNIPQRTAVDLSFPTDMISAQLATSVLSPSIRSQVNYYPNPNSGSQVTEFLVSNSISGIASLAGNSMFAASVYQIDGMPQGSGLNMLFPSTKPSLWPQNGASNIYSFIQFKGKKYYASETVASLVTAANAGGGGGVTIYGAYASNAAAIADGRVAGDLYKSSILQNGSYPIMQVI